MRRRAWIVAAVGAFVAVDAMPAAAAAASAELPGQPRMYSTQSTIEGVRIRWGSPTDEPGRPAVTGWVLRRSGEGLARTWTLPVAPQSGSNLFDDVTLPEGSSATYTVAALAGDLEGDPAQPTSGTHVVDPGPFANPQRALTMTWGNEDAQHEGVTVLHREGAALDVGPTGYGIGVSGRDRDGDLHGFALPWPLAAGRHVVGSGPGELELPHSGCGDPTGSLDVRFAAPTHAGFWKHLSFDADLRCDDGNTLRVQGRYDTPDGVDGLLGPRVTTVAAAAGESTTRAVQVRNAGDAAVTVRGARLVSDVAHTMGTLGVDSSTCMDAALEPGSSCSVLVRQDRAAGTAAGVTYRTRIVVRTDDGERTVGRLVGTPEEIVVGPQRVVVKGRPGLAAVSWSPGSANSASVYRVLDPSGRELGRSDQSPVRVGGLAPGRHELTLRQEVDDGRVYDSPLSFVLPEEWVWGSTGTDIRARAASEDPDAVEDLPVGLAHLPSLEQVDVAASPTRREYVAVSRFLPRVTFFDERAVLRSWEPAARVERPRYNPDGSVLGVTRAMVQDGDVVTQQSGILLRDQRTGIVTEVPRSTGWTLADWTPDGMRLLVTRYGGTGLYVMSPETGAIAPVPGAADASDARVSRDGRLAVSRTRDGSLYELPVSGGVPRELGISAWGRYYTWDTSGTRIALSSQGFVVGSAGQLWDVSAAPRKIRDLPTSDWGVAWADPSSSPPAAYISGGVTSAFPELILTLVDDDDAPAGLTATCALDDGPAQTCAGLWRPGRVTTGQHTVTVRVTDPSGAVGERRRTWTVDGEPPTADLEPLPRATISRLVPLRWLAQDTGGSGGVQSVSVRYRRMTDAGPGAWRTGPTFRSASRGVVVVPTSGRYCFAVQGLDRVANSGSWSAERCTIAASAPTRRAVRHSLTR
ncbi:MAG: hypothetical protein ACRCYR_03920 [Phycicoccus sp.]